MKKFFLNLKILFCTLFFAVFGISQQVLASSYSDDYYKRDYSYNLFSAKTLDLSPYIFTGYSFGWVPYVNRSGGAQYGNMLRNGHHGFILGAGVSINRNYSVGLSFQRMTRSSNLRGGYSDKYPQIDGIRSEILLTNLDLAVRLPLSFLSDRIEFQAVGGFNIVSSNLKNSYNAGTEVVPVELASSPHKVGFGTNIGLAATYRIINGLQLRFECKRMFMLTRNVVKDSWLINTGVSVNF